MAPWPVLASTPIEKSEGMRHSNSVLPRGESYLDIFVDVANLWSHEQRTKGRHLRLIGRSGCIHGAMLKCLWM